MKKFIKKFIPEKFLSWYRAYKKRKELEPYLGDNVICPVCGMRFKKFGPAGQARERDNARCYNCDSLERHRLIWKYLSDKTDLFNKEIKVKMLHFAPIKAFYDILSDRKDIEYFPCDLFPDQYNYEGNTPITKVDITNIPFAENTFDIILCNHVLEHIPDDSLAMRELYRVMKSGGWGIFQVPIDYNRKVTYEDFSITTPEAREKAFGQIDHVRWYGQDYKDRLAEAGFDVKEDDYVQSFSSEELFKFGLSASEMIYYCRK